MSFLKEAITAAIPALALFVVLAVMERILGRNFDAQRRVRHRRRAPRRHRRGAPGISSLEIALLLFVASSRTRLVHAASALQQLPCSPFRDAAWPSPSADLHRHGLTDNPRHPRDRVR